VQVQLRSGASIDPDEAIRVLVLSHQVPCQVDLQPLHLLEKRQPRLVLGSNLFDCDPLVISLVLDVLPVLQLTSLQLAVMLQSDERLFVLRLLAGHGLPLSVALCLTLEFQVRQLLRLPLRLRLQFQRRATLDGVVVHQLEFL
jgi:hypothetical protein